MKIHYITPYALDKNLGAAYNDAMEMIPSDEDYGAIQDADTMFLTPDFGTQIYEIVKKHPEAGMFTCLTNRVGNLAQCYNGRISGKSDIAYHRRLAYNLKNKYGNNVIALGKPISGLLMIMQKKVWKKYHYPNGLLGVDNKISAKLLRNGMPIYLMKGVYMFHYYRLLEGHTYKGHLK